MLLSIQVNRNSKVNIPLQIIERRIYLIRRHKVMLDSDLAELYGVPTKRLKKQTRRNRKRFPSDFTFELTVSEASALRSHVATSNNGWGGRRFLAMAFTEPNHRV